MNSNEMEKVLGKQKIGVADELFILLLESWTEKEFLLDYKFHTSLN